MVRRHRIIRSQSDFAAKSKKALITSNSCLVRRSDTHSKSRATAIRPKHRKSFNHVVVKPHSVVLLFQIIQYWSHSYDLNFELEIINVNEYEQRQYG